ncbi:MAG: FHA domain-containing protein [Ignavibacteriaceae bacterium]
MNDTINKISNGYKLNPKALNIGGLSAPATKISEQPIIQKGKDIRKNLRFNKENKIIITVTSPPINVCNDNCMFE